ncbi:MAG: hypothetical protein PHH11_12770 [Methylomonas sp.]|nr:hypothetical protein [Methylomonas sp.]
MTPEKNALMTDLGAGTAGGLMSVLQAVLAALPSAVVGVLAFAKLAEACVDWYQISSREGESGYFIAGVALAGGAAGLVVGAVCGWKWSGTAVNLLKGLGIAIAIVLALAGAIAGLCRWRADLPPTIAGRGLRLEVQVRLPADATSEQFQGAASSLTLRRFEGQSSYRSEDGALHIGQAEQTDGRWIVPGEAPLSGDRGKRVLEVNVGGVYKQSFLLPMPAHPGDESLAWSAWLPRGTPEKPWPDGEMSYRYRVTVISALDGE